MMNALRTSILVLLLISISVAAFPQDIELIFQDRERLTGNSGMRMIKDINEEICSVIVIKSDIPGVKFYTNLGVEKVEFDSSEYMVWIPADARMVKLINQASLFMRQS